MAAARMAAGEADTTAEIPAATAGGGKGMARIARVVVPGLPHHVTQRGNRREPVFFGADDYRLTGD